MLGCCKGEVGLPRILGQIQQALEQKVAVGVVLADAGYGNGTPFRAALSRLGLQYMVGIESSTTVWEPGQQPLPAPARKPGRGAPPKRLQRTADHQPIAVKQLALGLPSSAWKDVAWRPGSQEILRSRFAAIRVRPAHRDYKRTEPHPEEWLLEEMALDRMAEERIGTHQILAFHVAGEDLPEVSGEDRQTPLDHRTRL